MYPREHWVQNWRRPYVPYTREIPFYTLPAAAALIEDYLQQTGEEPYDRLTAREREILKLIAEGHTSLAEKLTICSLLA